MYTIWSVDVFGELAQNVARNVEDYPTSLRLARQYADFNDVEVVIFLDDTPLQSIYPLERLIDEY